MSACFSFPTLIHSQEALTDSVGYQKQKTKRTLSLDGDMDVVRGPRDVGWEWGMRVDMMILNLQNSPRINNNNEKK